MKRRGIPVIIIGLVAFIAGFVLLERSGAWFLLMLAGIGCMIFGAALLMAVSGRVNADFFDNGQLRASEQPTIKNSLETDQTEQKQD